MRFYYFFSLILLCPLPQISAQNPGIQTKNVIIVAIDGLRNEEAFEQGSTYLPFIWDTLRHEGSIYTNFYNRGITVTNSAHSTIVTGVYQNMLNNRGIQTKIRPAVPTLAEYYRKEKGIPKEKTVYISGKTFIWRYPVSIFPGYGYETTPYIVLEKKDPAVLDTTLKIMDAYHPSLIYVLFPDVDVAGHTGDTRLYLGAIKQVDQLISMLWKKIQSDEVYKDNTTLIVTADHGRHSDRNGGWQAHGDLCHSCRHILFLAVGPDIKKDAIIEDEREQIDIAPTAGYLLGFDTPFALGKIMEEMLIVPPINNKAKKESGIKNNNAQNISNTSGCSIYPSLVYSNDKFHLLYSDNTEGYYKIYYQSSDDGGLSWTYKNAIIDHRNSEYIYPAICTGAGSNIFSISMGYVPDNSDSTFKWRAMFRKSRDNGSSWDTEVPLSEGAAISSRPAITSFDNKVNVVYQEYHNIISKISNDFGESFSFEKELAITGLPQAPSSTSIGGTSFTVWQNITRKEEFMNLWFSSEPFSEKSIITDNSKYLLTYDPSIVNDLGGNLHLVYTRLDNEVRPEEWELLYQKSRNAGKNWTEPVLITSPGKIIRPAIKNYKESIYVLWAQDKGDGWQIYGKISDDGGDTWQDALNYNPEQNLIIYYDFSVVNDTINLVWQGYTNNWDIFFTKIKSAISSSGGSTKPHSFNLSQNFPNPFNSGTKINYSIKNEGRTIIKLFNINGEEVLELLNEYQQPGNYSTELSAEDISKRNLASGVYYYRLTNGGDLLARKMILLK